MPKQYLITAAIEMPDGLGPRSASIAKLQPAIEAFRAALEKQGLAAVVTERLHEPRGPKVAKVEAPAPAPEPSIQIDYSHRLQNAPVAPPPVSINEVG